MYITEQFNSFLQTIQSKQKLQFLIYTPSKYTYHLFLIQQLINKSLTCLVNSNLFHLGCFSVNIKPRYKLIRHSLLNFILYNVLSTFFDYYISLCSLQLKSCQHVVQRSFQFLYTDNIFIDFSLRIRHGFIVNQSSVTIQLFIVYIWFIVNPISHQSQTSSQWPDRNTQSEVLNYVYYSIDKIYMKLKE